MVTYLHRGTVKARPPILVRDRVAPTGNAWVSWDGRVVGHAASPSKLVGWKPWLWNVWRA